MGDVITFPNQKWMRLDPIYPQPYEINCIVVYNFLDWTVPRPGYLSIFEHKWLDRISLSEFEHGIMTRDCFVRASTSSARSRTG